MIIKSHENRVFRVVKLKFNEQTNIIRIIFAGFFPVRAFRHH